ncbi:hypothetical protein [Nocardia puris]|uniref:Uncharacterized protein n=1 Tax=Nocardia puris TaxID=208602 RepID=A0A366DHH2_9NOCA|nr:hypothetical protein [Nocardia puris]RBO88784.1 hypothetical protein DFR74_1088 [Nocardia puris]
MKSSETPVLKEIHNLRRMVERVEQQRRWVESLPAVQEARRCDNMRRNLQTLALEEARRRMRLIEQIERTWIAPLRRTEPPTHEAAHRRFADEQHERFAESVRKLEELRKDNPRIR